MDGSALAATVLICTRDRAKSLRVTLVSLANLQIAQGIAWELVIVDNGSSDETASVVQEFVDRLPIRRAWEPNAGLSNARNRGIAEAAGRYIVWTDDDVEVNPDWLAGYLQLFADHPAAVVFGGRSVPRFEEPVVPWFAAGSRHLSDLLAVRDFGDREAPLSRTGDLLPFGLNYAVRADVQRQFPYDPELGVAPGRRRSGEEIDAIVRMLDAGFAGVWSPKPVVFHRIPRERQTWSYIFSYYRSAGEQRAEFDWSKKQLTRIAGAPPIVWLKWAVLSAISPFAIRAPVPFGVPLYARMAFNSGALSRWRRLD